MGGGRQQEKEPLLPPSPTCFLNVSLFINAACKRNIPIISVRSISYISNEHKKIIVFGSMLLYNLHIKWFWYYIFNILLFLEGIYAIHTMNRWLGVDSGSARSKITGSNWIWIYILSTKYLWFRPFSLAGYRCYITSLYQLWTKHIFCDFKINEKDVLS